MRWLYHLTAGLPRHVGAPDALPAAFAPESLAREGFVHCCYRDAIVETARLYFRPPHDALVVLQIDPRRLDVHVEIATTPRGPMPHVHGTIPRDAVRAVLSLDEATTRAPIASRGRRGAECAREAISGDR